MMVIATHQIEAGRGAGQYDLVLLHELGRGMFTAKKLADLWDKAREHKILFDSELHNDLDLFISVMTARNSTILELVKDGEPVGIFYLTNIIPRFDADAHIAIWDSIGRGREPIARDAIKWALSRYALLRLTSEIPEYQKGAIRFAERVGYVREGLKRNAVLFKGEPANQVIFGVTKEDTDGWI